MVRRRLSQKRSGAWTVIDLWPTTEVEAMVEIAKLARGGIVVMCKVQNAYATDLRVPEGIARAGRQRRPFRTIVVGFDGTPASQCALDCARALALKAKSKLYLVGVESLPPSVGLETFRTAVQSALRRYQEVFYRIRLDGMNEGLQIETFIVLGSPAECLLRKTQQLHASLLVIGPGSGTGSDSVSELVVRNASCAVLVAPGVSPTR
jgi:nucleotide-binding universal stress UspA family protein